MCKFDNLQMSLASFNFFNQNKYNMKKMLLIVALVIGAVAARAQNVYYDSTLRMPYVNVSRIYWTATSTVPTNRLYIRVISYDMTQLATLEYFVKDTTNYNNVATGSFTIPVTTNSLDSAKIIALEYIISNILIDRNGAPVLAIQ
jgi:hypothetical protein